MSNIDKRAQKELYAQVEEQAHSLRGSPREYQALTGLCPVNVIEMHAKKIQALLDELEAKDKAWSAQDNHINQQADRIESLEKKNGELGRALGAAEKRIAELEARDIDIKQHAQALFEAIANPSDHYVPAYARCLREALNGTSTGKGE
ncbi:hypothetical protein AWI06_09115 [Enterobacter hormaechei subsp. xiangfangensis]|uniref:hypothetical protein n=1 Tax=Enterobacter hormaechei TaxID=158836 RepID=UPI0007504AE2|nr:hypothetical protein [Enterobacter hormaechei]KUQ12351.1 hypothetical protein AWI06_09115 [Enterobacter hormaechei subsp. xiangfangensis]